MDFDERIQTNSTVTLLALVELGCVLMCFFYVIVYVWNQPLIFIFATASIANRNDIVSIIPCRISFTLHFVHFIVVQCAFIFSRCCFAFRRIVAGTITAAPILARWCQWWRWFSRIASIALLFNCVFYWLGKFQSFVDQLRIRRRWLSLIRLSGRDLSFFKNIWAELQYTNLVWW